MELTKSEIIDISKFFAEYLGYKYYTHMESNKNAGWKIPHKIKDISILRKMYSKDYPLGLYLCRQHTALRFYNSWDWMMEVYNKFMSDKTRYKYPKIIVSLSEGNLKKFFKEMFDTIKNNN